MDSGPPRSRDGATADDLVAVQMLEVHVPAEVAIDLLEGDLGPKLTALLIEIETGIELGADAATAQIRRGSAADRAWALPTAQTGVDYVIAGSCWPANDTPADPGVRRCHQLPVRDARGRVAATAQPTRRRQVGQPAHVAAVDVLLSSWRW
jgi:hypothetical protein